MQVGAGVFLAQPSGMQKSLAPYREQVAHVHAGCQQVRRPVRLKCRADAAAFRVDNIFIRVEYVPCAGLQRLGCIVERKTRERAALFDDAEIVAGCQTGGRI